jgi:RNA-directed DNA polymerase
MRRESHVRFCEGGGVRLPSATRLIVGFQHHGDGRFFLEQMRERFGEVALSLHPEKTRLIEFGRFAAERRKQQGLGKPKTFNFLGFTFICGKTERENSRSNGKPEGTACGRSLIKEIKREIGRRIHQPIPEQGRWLGRVVRGYFNYHAVPTKVRH